MANSNREAVIQASAAIARLREEVSKLKDELRRNEAHLDRLLSGESATALTIPAREALISTAPNAVDRSLNKRIISLLDSAPDKYFSSEDVSTYFPEANVTSIRSALARMADHDRIKRADRGKYKSTKTPNGQQLAESA